MPDPIGTTWQVATDEDFTDIVYDQSGDFSLSRAFADGELPYGVHLYARARFEINSSQSTDWSNPVKFHVHDTSVDTGIIGVCQHNNARSTSTNPRAAFSWIYANGNFCTKEFDWENHPIFSNIEMVTLDEDRDPVTMTKYPLFYIKTAESGPAGTDSEGFNCWWISPTPADGFRPHPAFKRTTEKDEAGKYIISDYIYLGTYSAHTVTINSLTCIGSSLEYSTVYSSGNTYNNAITYAENRNNESVGQTGWRSFDWYDASLIRFLVLIAGGTGRTEVLYGRTSTTVTKSEQFIHYKGTHDDPIVFYDFDTGTTITTLLRHDVESYTLTFYSPMDSESTETTDIVLTFGRSGYYDPMQDVLTGSISIGDDTHDVMEFFLPKTTYSVYGDGGQIAGNFTGAIEAPSFASYGGTMHTGYRYGYYGPAVFGMATTDRVTTNCMRLAKN